MLDVADRPAPALVRWLCWHCRSYLGDKAPDAQAPVVVRCQTCGKRNPLQPR